MSTPLDVPGRVRQFFSTRGLTLYQVSRESARIFGRHSPYYIPEHFYSALKARNAAPAIQQLVALSRISGYRLSDCMAVFGISLEKVSRLQVLLPRRRTVLLDASLYDQNAWIPWFTGRPHPLSAIVPIAQGLQPAPPVRAGSLLALNTRQFLYAKIGSEDILAFPDLTSGSIVRIDPSPAALLPATLTSVPTRRIFLLETASRLACGHLRHVRGNRVALCSTSFAHPQLELTLGHDATILGVVDAEIRPVGSRPAIDIPPSSRTRDTAHPPAESRGARLSRLIRSSRIRQGLSLREASAISRSIARALADQHYFASPGTLSECDRLDTTLPQVQKLLSLCILYGIGFWDFVRAAGLVLESLGTDPMPDELCGRIPAPKPDAAPEMQSGEIDTADRRDFLSALIDRWQEIPLFLRHSLAEITGLPHPSLLDFFYLAPGQDGADARLRNAALVTVNRRRKRAVAPPPQAPREHPVYMLISRSGSYLCAPCTIERGVVALHPQRSTPLAAADTEFRTDLEVIGEVTAILRHLA